MYKILIPAIDSVVKTLGASQIRDSYQLFMVPGMDHCGGGDGPSSFDMLTVLEQWVEGGKTPATIPAVHLTNGKPDRTRILARTGRLRPTKVREIRMTQRTFPASSEDEFANT
jgi:hypothetical protein